MKVQKLVFFIIILLSFILLNAANEKIDPSKLTVEELFRVKPFQGAPPRSMSFSYNDRYLAYIWNPYGERGRDLYVFDLKNQTARRVTSLEVMKEYDPPEDYKKFVEKAKQKEKEDELKQKMYEAQKDFLEGKDVDLSMFEKEQIEELKKEFEKKKQEKAEKEKAEKKTDVEKEKVEKEKIEKKEEEKEEWEWRDELKQKKEKEAIKPEDLYPGVSTYVWSKQANELVFEYRGDLFRYFPEGMRIQRLTMTDKRENIIAYTPDGAGYYYRDGNSVYRALFNSSFLFQINHELSKEKKFKVQNTAVSPDGKWMAILASKSDEKPGGREVQIMSYKTRFAEPTKVKREVTDDKRKQPEYNLYIRAISEKNYGQEPEPVFSIPGGDIWYEFSNISWSEDSSRYIFTTWEREKNSLKIWLGKPSETEKPEVIFENNYAVGHEAYPATGARFTPDGKKIAAVLDEFEFRQPQVIDIKTKERSPLIKGNFESYPIVGFTKDSQFMFIISDKDDPSMSSIYKVNLNTGEMTKVGKSEGMHRASSVSNNSRWLATNFGNWSKKPELYLIDTTKGEEKILTDSHDKEWEKYNLIRPELFKFKNRRGDTISGFIFKPFGWKPEDKRPGIVYIYGGPLGMGHTVETDTFSTTAYIFQMYMAAKHGLVTVAIDPRGQSGYGRNFADANFDQPGRPQVEDLEDLVKQMKEGFGVDTNRLGLYGWSFGGFQTQMVFYTSPDTFACGIAGAGPTEWENYNSWYSGQTISKSVREKPTLRKYSLLPLAKNLKKPLLLVHGMEDPNVLYQDTVNVYRELLEAGKETLVELFVDPEGRHGLGGVVFDKARFKKYEDWFLKHLGSAN
jgi:dipeptidyl aminopeptidase/acylaminoacyl peptidase